MKFTAGLLLDPAAQEQRDQAIEKSEQDRARREAANRKQPPRPADWRAYKRPIEAELDREISIKTQKGRI